MFAIMKTFKINMLKNEIDSMFNNLVMVMSEINWDIKKIMLNIMTSFSGPKLQVAYA